MQLFFFLLIYPLLWLISILPFRLLYALSDGIYLLVYHVVGYRKRVVRRNLELAFPEKTKQERLTIEKKSYRHLCDMFLEMIKTMSISQAEIERRFTFANLDLYLDFEKKGKDIALMCAHYASYEWVISMNSKITFRGYAIYKQIANKYFDKLVRDIRSKFKAALITTKETRSVIQSNKEKGVLGVYGFASDQAPRLSKAQHWTNFMGIYSPIHTGAETLAKKYDMNLVFLRVRKVKRGFYEATFEALAENPQQIPDFQISEEFMKRVEKQIKEAPEFYLWTHKRWKTEGKLKA
ncbi:Lipid A biosynthesis acyltransferase [Flavobacterium longum]|uniref:lysophospholipid acyltransferase family protein n=1 Tax=Flavobacterium longum TaxID=1299340 RepID=UPI0039EC372B